ncbi:hypothetical protein [Tenacibaculum sp.]|uniref:hypothetical protein n=1 Tax=Tenacibaculum sp. TaxID=1906242 RepID=UPI003D147860
MKKYLILILMFTITYTCHSQDGLSFTVLQDIKLGLGMDKDHGNDRPTPDFIIAMNFEGKQFEWYYFSMQSYFEHASLSSGYFRRYGVNATWTLNQLVINKLKISVGGGIGVIHRKDSGGMLTYGVLSEISYPVTKHFSMVLRNEINTSPDLPNKDARYNLSLGFNYEI